MELSLTQIKSSEFLVSSTDLVNTFKGMPTSQ